MSSFEWMELQTLTSDIAESRSRLAAARSGKDHRLTRVLEQEIRTAEERRNRLLAHITNHVASATEQTPRAAGSAPPLDPAEETAPDEAREAVQEDTKETAREDAAETAREDVAETAREDVEKTARDDADRGKPVRLVAPAVANGAASPASAGEAGRTEGGIVVWDQLTPSDIEHAKNELGVRRAEMLARHAEELKGLDTDMTQLDGLEQAIAAFARKFKLPSQGGAENGAVVALDEERGLRVGRS